MKHWPIKSVLMEKYRIKEEEASAFADFLLPMLRYYPDQRASAEEMLKHPWLNMPDNFDYLMSEREYQSMMMKTNERNKKTKEKKVKFENSTDVIDSDIEINMGDDEDNDEYDSESSLNSTSNYNEIHIQNFDNSFAAYGQHINLDALDKANPQFDEIK